MPDSVFQYPPNVDDLEDAIDHKVLWLKHKSTYRSGQEWLDKKGNQYGPFSRSYWVKDHNRGEAEWVIHVHFASSDAKQRRTPKWPHAKPQDDEYGEERFAFGARLMRLIEAMAVGAINQAKDQRPIREWRDGKDGKDWGHEFR